MVVTFCGHRDTWDADGKIKTWLKETLECLIEEGATEFYLGGYGRFDALAAQAVREAKKTHPEIRSILVVPYLGREYNQSGYDEIIYPPIETVPLRFAIVKRNEYMVEKADVVVSGVMRSFGGAAHTLAYAKQKKKRILSFVGRGEKENRG